MPNLERKHRIHSMKLFPDKYIIADDFLIERGEILQEKGFDIYDALHLACAEYDRADIMLTTDDKLQRLSNRYANILNIRVANPLL